MFSSQEKLQNTTSVDRNQTPGAVAFARLAFGWDLGLDPTRFLKCFLEYRAQDVSSMSIARQ